MKHELFSDSVLFTCAGVPVTQTMVTSFGTSVVLLVAARWSAKRSLDDPKSRAGAGARLLDGFLRQTIAEAAGTDSIVLQSFAGALFVFIAGSALVGQLPGLAAPTSNLAAAAALACIVFVAVPIAGIHKRGARAYFKEYFQPNPLLFPLHVISELSRTLALALRLFGNMMSGHLVVSLVVALVGMFVPVPLMALDLLIGFLQAYIFTILACVYVGAALRVGGSE